METTTVRNRPPDRRRSWTQKVRIDGQSCYMTVGEYPDGRPCEVFIDVHKCGSTLRGVLDDMARVISLSLQHGTSVESVAKTMRRSNYRPNGPVSGSKHVKECTSVIDWVMSELEASYAHTPQADKPAGTIPSGSGV